MGIFDMFNNHHLADTEAFEEMCCQLFEVWGKRSLDEGQAWTYRKIRGTGGDGGIEAYWHNETDDTWVGIQAKWFTQTLDRGEVRKIRESIETAIKLRPSMKRCIVCIPHDLTSMKRRKDKAPATGEDERWESFAAEMQGMYPTLELDLWTASIIQTMLLLPENEGCQRFWFERSAINPEAIAFEVEKATNALSGRYIPALTDDGGLSSFLDHFYGTRESRRRVLKDVETSIAICEQLKEAIRSFLEINKSAVVALRDIGNRAIQDLNEHMAAFERLRLLLVIEPDGLVKLGSYLLDDAALYELSYRIRELKGKYQYPSHTDTILELLDKYEYMPSCWDIAHALKEAFGSPHCLVTGSQGTGKTCGFAGKANDYLMSKCHLPILIQASKVRDGATWNAIIADALGLGADWDEVSMWQALSASAAMFDVCDECLFIRAKVAILVDGLDELPPASKWVERIREADAITARYPRIRFSYSTRPHGVAMEGNSDIGECWYQIEEDGDVPVCEIFDRYMDYYGIDVNGNAHYKWLLKTPMELGMFSQAHRGQRLFGSIATNLTSLVNQELDRLDEEYLERHGAYVAIDKQPVRRTLLSLASAFMHGGGTLDYVETEGIVNRACGGNAAAMIGFLTSYGVLDRREERDESPFGARIITFFPGSRHLWDYYMARLLLDENATSAAAYVKNRPDAAIMYGILLVETQGKLPIDCDEMVASLGEERARSLSLAVLASCETRCAERYKSWVLDELKLGGKRMKDAVTRLILQTSEHDGHPLGPVLLDEYLRGFSSPIERDAIWSLPNLRHEDMAVALYEERRHTERMPKLHAENRATQVPLLFAWMLSSLSNIRRSYCRAELVTWGMDNPIEFAALFKRFADCDDPQIREDMFAIASEVVCQGKPNPEAETALGRYAIESVFCNPDKPGNRDAAVRYFGGLLVNRCRVDGLLNDEEAGRCLPPYEAGLSTEVLPVYVDACGRDQDSGYWPIHYDLSRYVLVYHLESAFGLPYHGFSSYEENDHLIRLLDAFAETVGIPRPKFDGWVIGAAYQYLLDHGYDPSVFETMVLSDGVHKEGIDGRILYTYHHADHGSRSEVMTVSEKYVWCARNEIAGYLADRIPVRPDTYGAGNESDDDKPRLVRDYSQLLDFDSPLLEATYAKSKKSRGGYKPDFPGEFACNRESLPCSKAELEAWVRKVTPEIGLSLLRYCPEVPVSIESEKIPINLYASDWGLCGKECIVWACAGAACIPELERVEGANSTCINGYDLSSRFEVGLDRTGGATYLSPVEVLSSCQNIELDETFKTEMVADVCIDARPLSGKGVSSLTDVGDYWFLFPSSLARDLCGITHTNGSVYVDDDGRTIFEDLEYGTPYRCYYRALLADKGKLLAMLRERGLCLVWHLTVRRTANALARERLGDSIDYNENSWLVWLDHDDVLRACPISHEQAEHNVHFEVSDILNELMDEQEVWFPSSSDTWGGVSS